MCTNSLKDPQHLSVVHVLVGGRFDFGVVLLLDDLSARIREWCHLCFLTHMKNVSLCNDQCYCLAS